ncbi:OsmC family protein [Membranihabitans maritimus]|uniref:OsmC family protein n=1 Tax=Membranihabitans maritimus TaxID=2904244 RepID=UPI001F237430|nr:OsmC family protein [Membranihabitans maritimus]
MKYSIKASSIKNQKGSIKIKKSEIIFGITSETDNDFVNPAEIFLSAFSSCILKNVERFSGLMKFKYTHAEITVNAVRLDKPSKLDNIHYELLIHSDDKSLNINLLKKNIEKFGTIYNTIQASCSVVGVVKVVLL